MSYTGKGDRARPIVVDKEEFKENWNSIFGEKPILVGYCNDCGKKESWCQCHKVVPKEIADEIDKSLGIERKE